MSESSVATMLGHERASAAIVVLCLAVACLAQAPTWQREDKTDPLRGTSYSQYTLTGKFLTPLRMPGNEPPVFIVKCIPSDHRRSGGGYVNGKLMDAYIVARAVVNHASRDVFVQYRLDDGKMHKEFWGVGTDGTAIFPPEIELNTVLYGHFLPHKEGTNDPTHKLVMGVNEYLGAEIVMQFDMPDPTEMADACGLLIHKK